VTTVNTGSQGTTTVAPASDPARPVVADRSSAPAPAHAGPGAWQMAASILGLALMLVLGFFVYLYGLSHVTESRAQAGMFKNFVYELGAATAPIAPSTTNANGTTTPLAERTPVAVLSIPQIGLNDVVVVEGTTSRDLTLGPGHDPSTVLPGQAGVSFIFGKSATYGAPFANLMRLNRGNRFTVTTGQGTATYVVESFGTGAKPAPADDDANRLVLETAASSFFPSSAVQVSADLVSRPQTNPGGWPDVSGDEAVMGRDTADGLVPLTLWSQALLVAVIIATVGAYRWSRWPTYLLMAPVLIALTWCVYENLAVLLPNLY
jgi:sortase A